MGDVIDPSGASIDGLIDWLKERRVARPAASLADLLSNHQFEPERLVDLACIDLIQRRRMGHAVTVETYLNEFPTLADESTRLDLIDAELCVANELGNRSDVEHYIERFPDLAAPIRELVSLDGMVPPLHPGLVPLGDSRRSGDPTDESCQFLLPAGESPLQASESPSQARESALHAGKGPNAGRHVDAIFPFEIPRWFVSEKPVASSPGRWLIQGRDAKRGIALAMKVVELPTHLTATHHTQILDACEVAAKVRNRAWVVPSVATIAGRHLAVIRPWVFASPWRQFTATLSPDTQRRNLAAVAFAIQSAHDVGATHGGVHLDNLLLNHSGQVQLVDAICTANGLPRWLRCDEETGDTALQERTAIDVQGLIKLVLSHAVEWNEPEDRHFAGDLRGLAHRFPTEACGRIGDRLMGSHDQLDSAYGEGTAALPWRERLKQWLSRD